MKSTKSSHQNAYHFDHESELQKALKRKDNVDHLGQILKAEVLLKTHKAKNPPKKLPVSKPCHKKRQLLPLIQAPFHPILLLGCPQSIHGCVWPDVP